MLKRLGFESRPQNGTSHEHWVSGEGKPFRKVTLDQHNSPYHRRILKLMLAQAGLSKHEFFQILDNL
ncbi:type II toxin-antitoxin system HicA family toxin [Xanthomonas cucurbitae]|uniref:Type II toxin-antitoxin system HicA family toxin n=1 Tax=Xanthomonas cucurbitae TaxID=56453 RepID=A0ABY7YD44_9XANT|nr:type II toxin-antitoxin system HicA family toxin [Xanthomonas cucurbitae]WDM71801.1 type II toxin-antitoxin system HicA family toxin [Xanthomonas cucurbitae]